MVERLAPEREVVSSKHSPVIPKTWKMTGDILIWALSLWAISINQRGGCLGRMLCERLPCPNGELNALDYEILSMTLINPFTTVGRI